MNKLTDKDKQAIKVLNFIATFDGVITHEEDIKCLLEEGIKEFIPKTRQHLVSISENTYPIRIIKKQSNPQPFLRTNNN